MIFKHHTVSHLLSVSLVFAVILSCLTGFCSAAIINTPEIEEPMIYAPCSGGNGICQLYSHGWAYVYDEYDELLPTLTHVWQCRNCNSVMVTSGEPTIGTKIGDYVVIPVGYPLGNAMIAFTYNVKRSDVRRCELNYLEGYNFHNTT